MARITFLGAFFLREKGVSPVFSLESLRPKIMGKYVTELLLDYNHVNNCYRLVNKLTQALNFLATRGE